MLLVIKMNERIKKCVDKKYLDALSKYKVKCKCGHVEIILNRPIVCNFCGRMVYRDKKQEFISKLERKLR